MRHCIVLPLLMITMTACAQTPTISSETVSPLAPIVQPPYIVGIYPDTPFLHTVGVTGPAITSVSADGLPKGLTFDSNSRIISGRIKTPGTYKVTISASNSYGKTQKELTIVAGDTLALTPPMGWMTWNLFKGDISEKLIMEVADALVDSGMRDVGYHYIIIDDLWQGKRDSKGFLPPHPKKFPNGMQYLADYVHSKGLKLGIYSDAAKKTCARAAGSFGHEKEDAQTFAKWGIDYLKYDYCHAPKKREVAIKRYTAMADALKATNRSIIFAACEWGRRQPWLWAKDAGAQLWRTTWDIRDIWDHGAYTGGRNGIINCLDRHVGLEKYVGPGHWNDPDMLVIGLKGRGKPSSHADANGCTYTEYQAQMSLWCLMAAPLTASCDVRNMEEDTIEILTNTEAIAIDQDPLGIAAGRIWKDGQFEIWARPLQDGSKAVGLLNRSETPSKITATWKILGIDGPQNVRNVWTHKTSGPFEKEFSAEVPSHGVVLLKITPCSTNSR